MKETAYLGVLIGLGAIFFLIVILALYWSVKSGQWKNLNAASRCIFNEEEPEGVQTDFFPGQREKARKILNEKTKD